jgi:hypothetical protein
MLDRIVDYPCQIRSAADHHRSGEEGRTMQDDQQTIQQLKTDVLFSRRDSKRILDDMVRMWAVKFCEKTVPLDSHVNTERSISVRFINSLYFRIS